MAAQKYATNHKPNPNPPESVIQVGLSGTIRRILPDRGFGFVTASDGFDYFFHWTALNRESKYFRNLREGDSAKFDIEPTGDDKGYRVRADSMFA